jgi:hypothetical protein
MAKSTIKLLNGTIITVEGSTEEIKKILSVYSSPSVESQRIHEEEKVKDDVDIEEGDIIVGITNSIKEHNKAESIEKNILDRSSQVNRILLPLYINQEIYRDKSQLSSGEIARILNELGTPINIANISNVLASSKYVVGNKTRKKGQLTKYKISLRGFKYLDSIIKEKEND